MTIGIAQVVSQEPGGGAPVIGTMTQAITISAGSTIAAIPTCDVAITNPTFSVDDGTAYTAIDGEITDTGAQKMELFYLPNGGSGSHSVVLTFSLGSANAPALALAEISGAAAASLDVHGPGQLQTSPGTGTDAVTSGAAQTNTQAPGLIFGIGFNTTGDSSPAAGTGFTSAGTCFDLGSGLQLARIEGLRFTTFAGRQATLTSSTNSHYITTMAVFLETGASGPGGTTIDVTPGGVYASYPIAD